MELTRETMDLVERLRTSSREEAEAYVSGLRAGQRPGPRQAEQLREVLTMVGRSLRPKGDEGWRWVSDPESPVCQIRYASLLVDERRWQDVINLLAEVDDRHLDPVHRQHRLHLLGLAHFRLGDIKAAVHAWENGLAVSGGQCADLRLYIELAHILEGDCDEGASADSGELQHLVSSIREADDHLTAGDVEAALNAIDHQTTWRCREVQSFARLAAAHLERIAPPAERLRKTIALAVFCQLYPPGHGGYGGSDEIPLLDSARDQQRLDDIAARAQAWLVASGAHEEGEEW